MGVVESKPRDLGSARGYGVRGRDGSGCGWVDGRDPLGMTEFVWVCFEFSHVAFSSLGHWRR